MIFNRIRQFNVDRDYLRARDELRLKLYGLKKRHKATKRVALRLYALTHDKLRSELNRA